MNEVLDERLKDIRQAANQKTNALTKNGESSWVFGKYITKLSSRIIRTTLFDRRDLATAYAKLLDGGTTEKSGETPKNKDKAAIWLAHCQLAAMNKGVDVRYLSSMRCRSIAATRARAQHVKIVTRLIRDPIESLS